MIRLPDVPLPASTQRQLSQLQLKIDTIMDFAVKVSTAKTKFTQHNRPNDPIFRQVRASLAIMCSGARRCGYCEDSGADEVEHIKPKSLYPELTFVWENYLYACGPCNGPKNNQFAVFSDATGLFTEVTRRKGDPLIAPESGAPVLIDPRTEDALEYMELDLVDTFYFLPIGAPDSRDYQRAEYTITVLRLNERDILPTARKEAFCSYRARLVEYIRERDRGVPAEQLNTLVEALQRMGHPTVWIEMKRQQRLIPSLKALFDIAPEALNW